MKISISICVPENTRKFANWGDLYFALSMQKSFEKLAFSCQVLCMNEWHLLNKEDIHIHIRGLYPFNQKKSDYSAIWIINHPELITLNEINEYQSCFCASMSFNQYLNSQNIKSFYIPQAGDHQNFFPVQNLNKTIDVLFVGNNHLAQNGLGRKIVEDYLKIPKRLNFKLIGAAWKGFVSSDLILSEFAEWQDLNRIYQSAHIVLNDHHQTMKDYGFVNNRTYDLIMANQFQICDHLEDIETLGIITYKTPEDLHHLILDLLQNPHLIERNKKIVQTLAIQNNFDQRMAQMLDILLSHLPSDKTFETIPMMCDHTIFPEYKFLFYIERSFHLYLFMNIIDYIHSNKLGQIMIFSPPYQTSDLNQPNYGIKKDEVDQMIRFNYNWLNDPREIKADFCFIADSSYQSVENCGFIVNIGHGTISKGSFFTDTPLSYRENCADLFCCPGPVQYQTMKKYLYKNMMISGMPKLDKVFQNRVSPKEAKRELLIDESKQTVLIAPTYNPEFSLLPVLNDIINQFSAETWDIIIKTHAVTPFEYQQTLNQLDQKYSNICIYTNQDLELAFHAADLMISDVSSIAFEFMAIEKPVIFYNSPLMRNHPKYNPNDIEHRYRHKSICFSAPDQIIPLVNMLNDPEIKHYYKDTARLFVDNRTNASEIVVQNAIQCYKSIKEDSLITSDRNLEQKMLYNNTKFYDELNIDMDGYKMNVPIEVLQTMLRSNIKFFIFLYNVMDLSPNLFSYLKNAVHWYPEALICPLSYNQDYPQQNIRTYYPETNEMSFQTIKTPLSYRYSGIYSKINDFSPRCFAFSRNVLNELFDQLRNKKSSDSYVNLIDCLRKLNKNIVCIHDAIYQ